jgi:RNA polymerase sigma-70 factor (ECF subfamily)
VRRLQPIFSRVVYRVSTNMSATLAGDIDDAIQECFLKLQAIDQLHPVHSAFGCEQNALAYLKVLAANAARDYFGKKFAEKRSSSKTTTVEDHLCEIAGSDAAELDRSVLIREIDSVLDGDLSQRTIFWLYYRQGLTAKEISQIQGSQLSQKGVESLLRRLTLAIRRKFDEGFSGPEAY